MPALGKLSPQTITTTLDLGGEEPAKVTYRPAQIVAVEAVINQIDEGDDTAETRNVLARQCAAVIVGWDIIGPVPSETLTGMAAVEMGAIVPDGEVVPLDWHVLMYFPVPTLKGLLRAIIEDSGDYPKEKRNGSLGPGSTGTSTSSRSSPAA